MGGGVRQRTRIPPRIDQSTPKEDRRRTFASNIHLDGKSYWLSFSRQLEKGAHSTRTRMMQSLSFSRVRDRWHRTEKVPQFGDMSPGVVLSLVSRKNTAGVTRSDRIT